MFDFDGAYAPEPEPTNKTSTNDTNEERSKAIRKGIKESNRKKKLRSEHVKKKPAYWTKEGGFNIPLIQELADSLSNKQGRHNEVAVAKILNTVIRDTGAGSWDGLRDCPIVGGKPISADECRLFYLELHNWEVYAKKQDAHDALMKACMGNYYHPVKDWLEEVAESTKDEPLDLAAFFKKTLGLETWNEAKLVAAHLCGAAARAMCEEGAKHPICLVIHSPIKGIGKSETIKLLSPNPEWVTESIADINGMTDQKIAAHSKWLVEIGELVDLFHTKADARHYKSFISAESDTFRKPYGYAPKDYTRRFAWFATSNGNELFSNTETERRFWVINVHPTITFQGRPALDCQTIEKMHRQIWGEAARRVQELGRDAYEIKGDLFDWVIKRNATVFAKETWLESCVTDWITRYKPQMITIKDVVQETRSLGVPHDGAMRQIGQVLRNMGYEVKENVVYCGQNTRTVYVHPSWVNTLAFQKESTGDPLHDAVNRLGRY